MDILKSTVYTIVRDFKKRNKEGDIHDEFFVNPKKGSPSMLIIKRAKDNKNEIKELVVALRKKMLSVQDIKAIVDALVAKDI